MKENSKFVATATETIVSCLDEYPSLTVEACASEFGKGGKCFKFPKFDETGFNVQLEVFNYGIYPYAEGWHGAPWDVTAWDLDGLKRSLQEFIHSVLTPAGHLGVYHSNGKAYKHVLHHAFEGSLVADETGLLFFNWLGRRSRKCFVNNHHTLGRDFRLDRDQRVWQRRNQDHNWLVQR